jgi:hypothetical protein
MQSIAAQSGSTGASSSAPSFPVSPRPVCGLPQKFSEEFASESLGRIEPPPVVPARGLIALRSRPAFHAMSCTASEVRLQGRAGRPSFGGQRTVGGLPRQLSIQTPALRSCAAIVHTCSHENQVRLWAGVCTAAGHAVEAQCKPGT